MSEPGEQQQKAGDSFSRTIAKKALAPVVATAATAATGYAVRKGTELWQEKVAPKLAERGGGMAVASETLGSVKEKLPVDAVKDKLPAAEAVKDKLPAVDAVKEKLPIEAVKEKLPVGESSSAGGPAQDKEREQERRKREQRRQQRRKSLEQAS
jgi:hypothetical protein